MSAAGWSVLPVTVSLKGVQSALGKQLGGPLAKAGKKAGKDLGDAMADGAEAGAKAVEEAQKRAENATKKVADAEKTVQDAKEKSRAAILKSEAASQAEEAARLNASIKVKSAEQAYQKLKDSGKATAEQLAVAEKKVEKARLDGASGIATKESSAITARKKAKDAADALKSAEDDLSTAQRRAADAADNVKAATARAGSEMASVEGDAKGLKSALSDMGDSADSAGGMLSGLKDKAGLLAGAAGIGGLGAAFATGLDITTATDKMNRALGLTGGAAEELKSQVSDVMRSGVAGSSEEAVSAVESLSSQFKYLGFEGEQTAGQLADNFLALSDTFGVELPEATNMAGQLIKNGLAGDVEEAADLMTTAFQRVPAAMRDELPDLMNEYGTYFSSLGLDGQESFGLIVNAADQGKIAMDKVGDAVKEFGIRATDLGDTGAVEALDALGLAGEDVQNRLLAGGDTAKGAFQQVVDELMKVQDPAEQASAAIALFGTPLEDLDKAKIPGFLAGLQDSGQSMQDFAGSSQEMADSIGDSLQGRMDSLKGTVQSLVGDAFMKLWDTVQPITEWARDNGSWLGPLLTALGTFAGVIGSVFLAIKVGTGIMAAFNAVAALNPIILWGAAIAAVVAAIVLFFTKTELGKKIWQGFMDVLKGVWEWIKGVFGPVFEWLGDVISAVWDGIKKGAQLWWKAVKKYFELVTGAFRAVWEGMKKAWSAVGQPVIDFVKKAFGMWVEAVKKYFELVKLVWAVIWETLKAVWEGIGQPILDFVVGAFQMWWDGIKIIFGWLQDGWNVLWGFLQSAWDAVGRPVIDFVVAAFDGFKSALGAAWDWIKDRWNDLWNAIQAAWDAVGQPVVDFVRGAFDRFRDGIGAAFDTIKGFAQGLFDAIKSKFDAIADVVGGIKDKILGAVSGAKDWLVETGHKVVDGLISGILSMKDAVLDAILSIIPSGIRNAVGDLVSFITGADGMILHVNGGIRAAEAFANGGTRGLVKGREKHVAQIAPAGTYRLWAEEETGGEAYIPLALSKRTRSKAILAKTAQLMGLTVTDQKGNPVSPVIPGGPDGEHTAFANGGIRTAKEMLDFAKGKTVGGQQAPRSLEGAPYVWGGGLTGNWGDCSGAQSGLAAFMTGANIQGRKFATGSEGPVLKQMGFTLGKGPTGTFRIGWFNGGPYGGHTSGTLPDGTNVEMGGGRGNGQIGGQAAAWNHPQFTDWAWIKPKAAAMKPTSESTTSGTSATGTTAGGDQNIVQVQTKDKPKNWSDIAGDFAKDWASGMTKDALSVFGISDELPPIFQARDQLYAVDEKGEGADAVNAQIADAVTGDGKSEVPEVKLGQVKKGAYKLGANFFWEEIAKAASERRLGLQAARIAGATMLVEVGEPPKMFASGVDTGSQAFPHDAVGYDHDSSGLFQQRNNGAWGSVDQRMNARASAAMFLNQMVKKFPNWKSMSPGAVAQGVQVSAFPDRYATKLTAADKALAKFKGKLPSFATGTSRIVGGARRGVDDVLALLGKDEAVLTAEAADTLGRGTIDRLNRSPKPGAARQLVGAGAPVPSAACVDRGGDTYIFQAVNTDELNTMYRRAVAGRTKGARGAR